MRGYLSEGLPRPKIDDAAGKRPAMIGRARCLRETARAIYVGFDTGGHLWIPQSVIHDDSEVYGLHHHGDLVVHEWFARKNCPKRF